MKASQRTGGGETDNIWKLNSAVISVVLFFNVLDQIDLGQPFLERLVYTAPFVFMLLLGAVFRRNITFISIIYLIIAIGTSLDPENVSDYSGSIFFMFSFHIVKKKWYALVIIFTTMGAVAFRSIINGDTVSQAFVLLSVFFYIYAIYYFLIYKPMSNRPAIKIEDLTIEENNMLQLLAKGLSQKEAAAEMDIKHTKAAYLIKQIKDKTGYVSLNQLFYDY